MWRSEDLGAYLYDDDLKQYVEITSPLASVGDS